MTKKPIRLIDLFRYYQGLPHQCAALNELETLILKSDPTAFNREQDWYTTWKSAVDPKGDVSWSGIKNLAKQAGAKYPECVAAQWALESGWGKHTSGKNNFFGLKGAGTTVMTTEYLNGAYVSMEDSFIDFPSPGACVKYLVERWYLDYGGYRGVNNTSNRNECARELVRQGYATDPHYAEKLIRLMNENDNQSNDPRKSENILAVPYNYQLDNASGTGYRECFSSSCASIAQYYGKVSGDDEYNRIRNRYGDTTSSVAQVAALRSLNLDANFITNGTADLLMKQIDKGQPVAVGWLHYGTSQYPSGGGHWTCCVGYTEDCFVFHDPNGRADMANGGYLSNNSDAGKYVRYDKQKWLRRWECDGPGTGWAVTVDPN